MDHGNYPGLPASWLAFTERRASRAGPHAEELLSQTRGACVSRVSTHISIDCYLKTQNSEHISLRRVFWILSELRDRNADKAAYCAVFPIWRQQCGRTTWSMLVDFYKAEWPWSVAPVFARTYPSRNLHDYAPVRSVCSWNTEILLDSNIRQFVLTVFSSWEKIFFILI